MRRAVWAAVAALFFAALMMWPQQVGRLALYGCAAGSLLVVVALIDPWREK